MSVIYSITHNNVESVSKLDKDTVVEPNSSIYFSPNFLCQPFLTNGKNEADEANFVNDKFENPGAFMLNEIMQKVC
jgi:hypothetical protein